MTIKLKLTLIFLAISISTITLIGALSFYNARKALESARIAALESIAELKVDKIQTLFNQLMVDIEIAQDYFYVRSNLPIMTRFANDRTNSAYIERINPKYFTRICDA